MKRACKPPCPPLEEFLSQQQPFWNPQARRWELLLEGELYWFDWREASRPVLWIESFCVLPHGARFLLQPKQKALVQCLFGWISARTGLRRFRQLFLMVASGYGKSMLFSAILLYLLYVLAPPGAEMYNIAADVEQARPIFQSSVGMVDACPYLARRVEIYGRNPNSLRRSIKHRSGAFYQILTKTVHAKHGKRIFVVAIDEEHVLPGDGRDLVDTLEKMAKKHFDSLVLKATTAGFEQDHVCFEDFQRACAVRDGLQVAPELLPVLFYAEPDDDWTLPATWRKANPNLGITIREDDVAAECRLAQTIPSRRNQFLRLRCNIWTEQEALWLPVEEWDACEPVEEGQGPRQFSLQALAAFESSCAGQPCFGGLDLSANRDLTALARIFPPQESVSAVDSVFRALFTFWVPKDQIEHLVTKFHVDSRLLQWTAECHCWQGGKPLECPALVHATPGGVVDYDFIRAHINALNDVTPFTQLAVDKFGATQIITQLTGDLGEDRVIAVPQSFGFFTPPMRDLERLVLARQLRHSGHPVARWNLQCVAAKLDPAGGIRPVKLDRQKSGKRIDGIVALLNAHSRAVLQQPAPEAGAFFI